MFSFCVGCPKLEKAFNKGMSPKAAPAKHASSSSSHLTESDRDSILKQIYRGADTESIQKRYNGKYTRQQIAAVRAWVTMGKY
jgi:hypothetical protein